MIDSLDIYKKASELVQRYGTRDTVQMAESMGITVEFTGKFKVLLGMYVYSWRTRAIFLNNRMDDYLTQMVCGHEIGHDTYHRELAKSDGLKEFELFRMTSPMEYEANVFNAHILLDTKECLECARNGYDVWQIAKSMNSEMNLVLIKMQELERLGYNLRVPITPQGNFLKNIKV